MRKTRIGAFVASTALASATILGGAGIASAQDSEPVAFSATDNGDCTATFEVVNTTNSDINEINYWTGDDVPTETPGYGVNEGSEVALIADAAFKDANSADRYAPYSEAKADGVNNQTKYVTGLEAVTTEATVDFSDEVAENGVVNVGYRMTGVESDDYDTALKMVDVTGCDSDTGVIGSIVGSVDVFGSLGTLADN